MCCVHVSGEHSLLRAEAAQKLNVASEEKKIALYINQKEKRKRKEGRKKTHPQRAFSDIATLKCSLLGEAFENKQPKWLAIAGLLPSRIFYYCNIK